jgi:Uncharacterized protein conserved in bacteria (DUF2188)
MSKPNVHVVPHDDGWAVRRTGAVRVASKHPTQAEAIAAARNRAIRDQIELFIHGTDGRIRERNSYGADAPSPKG